MPFSFWIDVHTAGEYRWSVSAAVLLHDLRVVDVPAPQGVHDRRVRTEPVSGQLDPRVPYPEGMAKKSKMPTDVNQRAKAIVDFATGTEDVLYKSAYTLEAVYGDAAQQQSGVAQLVTTTKKGVRSEVGMSMAPSLWLVNFALLYTLKPAAAAKMPAHWAPIPPAVADAIVASPTGQVPFSDYASFFGDHLSARH
jgi:hypothetical protein